MSQVVSIMDFKKKAADTVKNDVEKLKADVKRVEEAIAFLKSKGDDKAVKSQEDYLTTLNRELNDAISRQKVEDSGDYFADVAAKNKAIVDKRNRERLTDNKSVLRSYRIDHGNGKKPKK